MHAFLRYSITGVGLFCCLMGTALAANDEYINVTLINSSNTLQVNRICTTNSFTDNDHCSIFNPAISSNKTNVRVKLGESRKVLLVRVINPERGSSLISTINMNLQPDQDYTITLDENGQLIQN